VSVEVVGQLTVQLTQRRATTKHDITRLVYISLSDDSGNVSAVDIDVLLTFHC